MRKIITWFLIIASILLLMGLFLLYGPISNFREWLITTSMSTMHHKNLAKLFYDDKTIENVLLNNSIKEFKSIVDLDKISIVDYNNMQNIEYKNEAEKEILEGIENNNDYKIIPIKEENFEGYLVACYDPSRVKVAHTKYLGKYGQYLDKIAEENNALISINAGGFIDDENNNSGGYPLGITITNNNIDYDIPADNMGIVGMTDNNKLFLGKVSSKQAILLGIRDCVSFGPYLILNGEKAKIIGNYAGGVSPKTAIAQRQDGIILFLVLDGNRLLGKGATYKDMVDILEKYGAYNASCLDGGTSTGMCYKNSFINNPSDKYGNYTSRPIATAFIYEADNKDEGNYEILEK